MNIKDGVQRSFVPGGQWLYYKLYMSPKTADSFLINALRPLVLELQSKAWIEKWFFIRYSDPDYHLRIRFLVSDLNQIGMLIQKFRAICIPFLNDEEIRNIQIASYQRELERYGFENIELSESLFSIDSSSTLDILSAIGDESNESLRWKLAVRLIDQFLNCFGFSPDQKNRLLQSLKESFSKEFGMDKYLKRQLDLKFREERKSIVELVETQEFSEQTTELCNRIIKHRNTALHPLCSELLRKEQANCLRIEINQLLSSYIHMLCNRYFRTKQRKHELVIYYLLARYYESKLAIEKKKNADVCLS